MRAVSLLAFLSVFLVQDAWPQTWRETQKIVASDRAASDIFGTSVSISGNYAIVGAPHENEDSAGGNSMFQAGSAYIYQKDSVGNWTEIQKITASDRDTTDVFGISVSISGRYAIIGAWLEDEDTLGGNHLDQAGSAYIFEKDSSGNWIEVQKIVALDRASGDHFGYSVAISGNQVIIGAYSDSSGSGSAYIFEKNINGIWSQMQKLVASDRFPGDNFGRSVFISGNYAISGAYGEDHDTAGGNYMNGSGSAYIFEKDSTGMWFQAKKIVALDREAKDEFGYSVSISGNLAIVGARSEEHDVLGGNRKNDAGSAYIFERDSTGNWYQAQKVVASDRAVGDRFGTSVSIFSHYVIIGASLKDVIDTGGSILGSAGSAYIFKRDYIGYWNQVQQIIASDRDPGDNLGTAVSISNNNAIIGALWEDHNIIGADSMAQAGSAYLFNRISSSNIIRGTIFSDQNLNCIKDSTEIGIDRIMIKAAPFFGISDSYGNYEIYTDSGTYIIDQIIPTRLAFVNQYCPNSPPYYDAHFTTLDSNASGLDFANEIIECPFLTIDISSNRRRRCFNNNTSIQYCNEGFADVDSVKAHVQFPGYVNLISASMPYTLDADSNYVFDIGTLLEGECGSIYIRDSVACVPNITGLTQCTKAWITPANSCVHQLDTTIQNWDQSSLHVRGRCERDSSITFRINNVGADMQDSSIYRIYADGQLVETVAFILGAGQSLDIAIPANGQTIRIEVDQLPGHPGNSRPTATVEACGANLSGTVSTGFVTQLPSDDEDVAMEEQCLVIRDSYDPNDKRVQPTGITQNHIVRPGISLDYTIRFQNTGTDTAYKVVVVDTLSGYLDIATIQFGVSSHPYELDVTGRGRPVLIFTFNNIFLPDSTTDEPNSHGFVKYKIAPYDTIPDGTNIHNAADIYFDFNAPVRTNDPWVTIADTVLTGEYILSMQERFDTICQGESIYAGGANQTTSGVYFDTTFHDIGIDVAITNLAVHDVDTSVVVSDNSFTALADNASFQWMNCNTGAIDGATNPSFTPSTNGNYAVIVTQNSCTDTSGCKKILGVGIAKSFSKNFNIYPNPAKDELIVEWNSDFQIFGNLGSPDLMITNPTGQTVLKEKIGQAPVHSVGIGNLKPGLYILSIRSAEQGTAYFRFVKIQ